MKSLTPSTKTDRDLLATMLIWLRLPNLICKLWGPCAISTLMSTISTPIRMDEETRNWSRISFARILVEVKMEFGFSSSIKAIDNDGNFYS